MLITGIRHAINSEHDIHRSTVFMRYLVHYLDMFAFIGMILPLVIGVDFFLNAQTKEEIITSRYYEVMDNLHIEYYLHTDSYRFLSDVLFYENTKVADQVTFHRTPIFKAVTSVSHQSNKLVYTCKPTNIYGWPLIIVMVSFVFSVILIIKTWGLIRKHEIIKYNSMVNLGIINAILCIFMILAVFLHIPNY